MVNCVVNVRCWLRVSNSRRNGSHGAQVDSGGSHIAGVGFAVVVGGGHGVGGGRGGARRGMAWCGGAGRNGANGGKVGCGGAR